jgi:hypothetical protein
MARRGGTLPLLGMVDSTFVAGDVSMAKNLYLASLEPASGKSLVALGLMEMLSRRTDGVGYFRPVIAAGERIAWIAGVAVSEDFAARPGAPRSAVLSASRART